MNRVRYIVASCLVVLRLVVAYLTGTDNQLGRTDAELNHRYQISRDPVLTTPDGRLGGDVRGDRPAGGAGPPAVRGLCCRGSVAASQQGCSPLLASAGPAQDDVEDVPVLLDFD